MARLADSSLPPFFVSADEAAQAGQTGALRSGRIRLIAAVAAAIGGAFTLQLWRVDVWAFVALAGFTIALVAELFIVVARPERRWYQARAAAESVKTLSWRFAVGADPFFLSLAPEAAAALFRSRVADVAKEVSDSVDLPNSNASEPTEQMLALRNESFKSRRETYLKERTEAQKNWYTSKARFNRRRATMWRVILVSAEVIAVILAAGRLFAGWNIDAAGILAAIIGAGAGWLSFKQHATLRAAYSLTAAELERQLATLKSTSEEDWAESVADAEEAISREHTMWLASRGEVNETLGSPSRQ